MNNKSKIITISITEEEMNTFNQLNKILKELNITRSSFFRNSANKFVKKYNSVMLDYAKSA